MQTARDDQQNPETVAYVLSDAEKTLEERLCHLMVYRYKFFDRTYLKTLTSISFKLSREVLSERTLVESNNVLKSVDETTIRLLSFFLIIDFCEDVQFHPKDFYIINKKLCSVNNIVYKDFIKLRDQFTILIMHHWAWDHLNSTMHRCSFQQRSSTFINDTSPSPQTDTQGCVGGCWEGLSVLFSGGRMALDSTLVTKEKKLFSPGR